MQRQLGGQQLVFRGPLYQQGYGLGGYFKKFFKWIIPIAEKHILPQIKSGVQEIGKQSIDSLSNIAKDVIKGRDLKEASKVHLSTAIDNLKEKAESSINGIKRKKKKLFY